MSDDIIHVPAEYENGLAKIRGAFLNLDDQRLAMYADGDYAGLAHGSADLKVIIDDLATLQRDIRLNIAELLIAEHEAAGGSLKRRPKAQIEGLGEVEVPGGKERKGWQSKELLNYLLMEAIVDPDSGEMIEGTAAEIIAAILPVLHDCLPLTASLGWKVGSKDATTGKWSGLRGHNIDPDDWSEETDKVRLADIPKRVVS
jgi:hypothetical protein